MQQDGPGGDEICAEVGIRGFPTFHFFLDGVKKDEVVGADPSAIESKVLEFTILRFGLLSSRSGHAARVCLCPHLLSAAGCRPRRRRSPSVLRFWLYSWRQHCGVNRLPAINPPPLISPPSPLAGSPNDLNV